MLAKHPQNRQSRRSSFSSNVPKELLPFKLFPILLNTEHLERRIQTYSTFSTIELKHLFEELIDVKSFKALVCNSLQFEYMYDAIVQVLNEEYSMVRQKCKIKEILELLVDGKFYRKLPKQSQFMFVGNGKTTTTNVKCLIASILAFVSGKLNMNEITNIVKVFQFQQKLYETYPFGIPFDTLKITRILKKLQRFIKPMEFKQWIEDFKILSSSDKIQNYQFLYLAILTSKKFQENSYQFFNVSKTKQSKSVKDSNEIDNQQKTPQNQTTNQNPLGHNQKYRLKSLQYQKSTANSANNLAFKEIVNKINLSSVKLSQKKKCFSLAANYNLKFGPIFKQTRKQTRSKQNKRLPNFSPLQKPQAGQKSFQNQKIYQQNGSLSQDKGSLNILNAQALPIIIKGSQKVLIRSNKNKLILTQDQKKINQKFNQLLKREQQKITRRLNDIIIEEY